ncbi:AMP-binding protein [Bacillus inaquosorum]|nr:AMP-binding protein [Bacillus inaquosorum]
MQADQLVGIMTERSLEMIVGILGILKAGGAYLPIDPDSPPERIRYILSDSGISVLLYREKSQNNIGFPGTCIDLIEEHAYHEKTTALRSLISRVNWPMPFILPVRRASLKAR